MPGSVETAVKYPTWYLKPKKDSRIVREVVYKEMERLSQFGRNPDVLRTACSVHSAYRTYRQRDYSIPELLSYYQTTDKKLTTRPTVESIPWETVPSEIVARCLDENMDLTVTDEVLEFLGFRSSNTIFDRYDYPNRYVSGEDTSKLIVSPRYDKNGRLLSKEYIMYDEDTDSYKRALVKDPNSCATTRLPEEIEYVTIMFNKNNSRNSLGLEPSLMARVLWSIIHCIQEYRKEYFGSSYIERLAQKSVEELRKERVANEREYAVSRRGTYKEDTSVLWRYGQLSNQ